VQLWLRKFRKKISLPQAIFRDLLISRSRIRFFLFADAIIRNIIYLCGAIEKNNLIHHEAKHFFQQGSAQREQVLPYSEEYVRQYFCLFGFANKPDTVGR
jgi:hypothetical protein